MNVSYRHLKSVLCIQELDSFRYTLLLVYLKPSLISPYVCVLKYKYSKKKKTF